MTLLLVNFSHPLSGAQRAQVEALASTLLERVIEAMPQADVMRPFDEEAREIVDGVGISPAEWQREAILVNLPGLAPLAAALLAELHGRMGYFPTIVRLRPVNGSTPTEYEVAEILNLQALRDDARTRRR